MSIAQSDVERTEAQLWEAVRALYGPTAGHRVDAAAAATEALAAYRAAVEAAARLRIQLATSVSTVPVAV